MPELTPQQLTARLEGMGSTDVVEVAGLAPWEGAGPWRVYNTKLGITPPSPQTEEQGWGHRLERVIAVWYVDHVGPFGIPRHSTPDPEHDWLWSTLDGITPERTVEIKNVSGFMAKHWDPTDPDGVPHYVRAQVQIGMRCARREECHVVASLAGRPPEMWTVRYDRHLADMLVLIGKTFWERVKLRDPPPLDASDACREYLRVQYPKDERGMLELVTPREIHEIESWGQERAEVAAKIKSLEPRVKELDSLLLARIGSFAGYECDAFKMTWKVDKKGTRRSRFTPRGGDDE